MCAHGHDTSKHVNLYSRDTLYHSWFQPRVRVILLIIWFLYRNIQVEVLSPACYLYMHSSLSSPDSVMDVWSLTQMCLKFFYISCLASYFQPWLWSAASWCFLDVMTENRATLRKVQFIHSRKPSQTPAASKEQLLCLPAASHTCSATLGTHTGSSPGGTCKVLTGQASLPWLFYSMLLACKGTL